MPCIVLLARYSNGGICQRYSQEARSGSQVAAVGGGRPFNILTTPSDQIRRSRANVQVTVPPGEQNAARPFVARGMRWYTSTQQS